MAGKKNKGNQQKVLAALSDRMGQQSEAALAKLVSDGRYVEAEQKARQFLQQQPHNHAVMKALSAALLYQEKREEGRLLCRELVALRPQDWECWANLAFIERDMNDWPAAFNAYNKALELNPKLDNLCFELAKLYRATNQNYLALHWFFEALKLKPESREYFLEWATSLQHLRKHEEALQCLQGAWEDEHGDPQLAISLIPVANSLAEWDLLDDAMKTFKQRLASGESDDLAPLTMLGLPGFDRQTLLEFTRLRVKCGGLDSFRQLPLSEANDAANANKVSPRIGYLSADIFNHATTYLMNGVLIAQRAAGHELYIYSYGPDDQGDRRKELMEAATVFRDIQMCSSEQAAEQIVADGIDILVDLKGWTKDFRPDIQALRPAPVIVSWLGYPGSLGDARLADYIIGDPVVTPLTHADGYAECIAQMPHCYQPNDNRRSLPAAKTRAEVGLPEQGLVFCSFNRVDKLTARMFDAWCRILKAVPGSVLWLLSDFPRAQENLRRRWAAAGLAEERLIFAPSVQREEHLARLQCADLALDSFPYTAHTTGSDALWAGVPLLALQGETFISRVSSSLVTAAGLPELVTRAVAEFEETAIALATTPERLLSLRKRLEQNRDSCALFDTEGFARDLQRLFQEIWKNHMCGQQGHVVLLSDKADISRPD